MRVRIRVRTPKGQACKTERRLRKFILGFRKLDKFTVNRDDSEIVWFYVGDVKSCLKIQKNVSKYDFILKGMLNNKLVKRTVKKHLSLDEQKQLKDMLLNQTQVEVLKG